MPSAKIKPREPGALWPEYSQDVFEILAFRQRIALRALAPSKDEIPLMEELLLLPNLHPSQLTRRVLHLRLLVDPLNQRYIYSWPDIASRLEAKLYTVKSAHKEGLARVVRLMPLAQRERFARLEVLSP